MAFQRGIDGSEPLRSEPIASRAGAEEVRRDARRTHLATATLACPACDAPVVLPAPRLAPTAPLRCPFCAHGAALRDFLSLAAPTRPTRVEVHVVRPNR